MEKRVKVERRALVGMAVLPALVGLLASYMRAGRAASVNPIVALDHG